MSALVVALWALLFPEDQSHCAKSGQPPVCGS